MTAAGGGAIAIENAAGILTVPGLVSGPEQLTKIGSGTLILSNPTNTYQGGTTLNGGILTLGGVGSLGTGDLAIGLDGTAGSTLRFNFAGTYAGNINHAASATFDTNTNAVTLSGVVSGNGATLTKAGGGTLTLSAANTYSSNTVVSNGTLMVTNTTGSGTGFGSVAVSPGASLGGTGTVGETRDHHRWESDRRIGHRPRTTDIPRGNDLEWQFNLPVDSGWIDGWFRL